MGTSLDNIILIGFMGTGKTAVGMALAHQLGYIFLDTDGQIVRVAKMPIPEIFVKLGEPAFRDYETGALKELKEKLIQQHVIACGGGIVIRPENRRLLKELGKVILLNASIDKIFERVKRDINRPLLQAPDPKSRIRELLSQREQFYKDASEFIIDTTLKSVPTITREIIEYYQIATH